MYVQLPAPRITIDSTAPRVASYTDLVGAAMAVDHLRHRGFDAAHVAVRPSETHALAAALAVVGDEPRRRVLVSGCAIAVVALSVVVGLGIGPLLGVPLVALLGAGIIHGMGQALRSVRRRRADRAASLLAVERWEVVCERGAAAEAEHELARWWDPLARPAPGRLATTDPRRLRVVAAA